jgi:glycosyltransferase involved in cell wall biosynthesis
MGVRRIILLGTMQTREDCGRNPYGSEALNETQLLLMQAFQASGVEQVIGLSIPGTSSKLKADFLRYRKRSTLETGLEICEIPFLSLGPLQPLTQLFSMLLHLAGRWKQRPDGLVVANPLTRMAVPAMLFSALWHIPMVIIVSDLTPPSATRSPLRRLQQLCQMLITRSASGVVVFSSHTGRDLRRHRPWIRMVRPPGQDLLDINANPPASTQPTAYFAGTLAEVSGVNLLLEAIERIPNPDYRFWFSGRGPLDERIRALAAHDARVTHWGFVSREKYLELLRTAAVLINPRPSRLPENRYNFPSKLMEYMAAGRPVISTATSDVAEHYADAVVLLDDETPERLAQLIQQVCEMSANEQMKLGQRARRFVQDETWMRQAQRILDFMQSL